VHRDSPSPGRPAPSPQSGRPGFSRRRGLLEAVGPPQRLVLVGEALHGDDGAEDLVLDDLVVLLFHGTPTGSRRTHEV
jgi:hypothetical protein